MMPEKGVAKNAETTSLLTKNALLFSNGWYPDSTSLAVRPGFHVQAFFPCTTGTSAYNSILPMCTEGVTLSGEPFVFVVSSNGYLYACPVNRLGYFYVVARRHFKYQESIYMFHRDGYYTGLGGTSGDSQDTAWSAKIKTVGKAIYILSNQKSWLIREDGIVLFDEKTNTLIVDALDATIYDIDNETPQLQQVNRYSSLLKREDRIYVRAKSEIGGYGAPSNDVTIPETNSYIVHGIKGMTNLLSIDRDNYMVQPPA